ncbi:ABC transporter substrate-binding protein [uncultured Methanoregula sp.]|uniref:ABC transporter substrate-binding protein n=1 Tax=uncultured Methanoregula sp. TaxID=1005933 RepID=UPI002AAB50F7|nr:ABC transporter substrate-binding protein [uncultured Methanoregula sp.]
MISRKNCPEKTSVLPALIVLCMVLAAVAVSGCTTTPAPSASKPQAASVKPGGTTPVTAQTTGPHYTVPVQRIIVTNANSAELLIAIGAKDRIVGISDTVKNHPVLGLQFAGVPSIGSWQTPDVEKILSLHPDVVICYSSYLPKNIDRIASAGITILPVDCYKIDTLAADAKTLGHITGLETGSEKFVAFQEKYESLLRSRTAGMQESALPRVYFESYSDYSTLTGGSGADTLVTMAGGRNIAALLPVSSPKVNAEWLVAENPDVIIKVIATSQKDQDFKGLQEKISSRQNSGNISAVKNGRVYIISNDIVYGPRAIIGALYIAKILHPEKFADIIPGKILDEYAGRFAPGTNTTPCMYPPGAG